MDLHVYGSRPAWDTPDFSPFVAKLETWLRIAGVPYTRHHGNPLRSPTGKIPYIRWNGRLLADSHLIQATLTRDLHLSLDDGLDATERACAHTARRMLEEGLYFVLLRYRWLEPDGWAIQAPAFGQLFPSLLRPFILPLLRRSVRRATHAQGIGRYTREDAFALGVADLHAIAALLGDRPFFHGDTPRSVDATIFASLNALQGHPGDTPLHAAARAPALLAYSARISDRFWRRT